MASCSDESIWLRSLLLECGFVIPDIAGPTAALHFVAETDVRGVVVGHDAGWAGNPLPIRSLRELSRASSFLIRARCVRWCKSRNWISLPRKCTGDLGYNHQKASTLVQLCSASRPCARRAREPVRSQTVRDRRAQRRARLWPWAGSSVCWRTCGRKRGRTPSEPTRDT